jgi:hypothetical protein
MHVQQANARQPYGSSDCAGHGGGNIVKLEVQENLQAQIGEPLHYPGASRGEQLAAHFDHADPSDQPPRQGNGRSRRWEIQGDD